MFTAKTIEGIDMTFKVISEANKTCQVGVGDAATNVRENAVDATTEGKLTIPVTANGYQVTELAFFAFQSCSKLTEIVIPEGVTAVPTNCFNTCKSLTEVTLPSTCTSIGSSAFAGTNALTKVTTLNPVPYEITPYSTFSYMIVLRTDLYVPHGTSEAYKATTGWTGFRAYYELDPISAVDDVKVATTATQAQRYNLMGQPVDDSYQGIVIQGGKKFIQK
ncbi:MAG: leucine-rich repeat domain-containing protein [Muribaculaceae bacterium]|nr:leucine-rich repeat domain-containing protein [Muribaculaceae bacterium]